MRKTVLQVRCWTLMIRKKNNEVIVFEIFSVNKVLFGKTQKWIRNKMFHACLLEIFVTKKEFGDLIQYGN